MDSVSCPLVSVVLPTYDRPDRVRRAVNSVLQQAYENIELVIVDDHSSIPAEGVLTDLPTERLRIRYLRHEENKGASAARNTGIEAARGELIAFLDDDDEWHPEKIERQVEAFRTAGPRTGVVYTGIETRNVEATATHRPELGGDVTKGILNGRSLPGFPTVMIQANVIEDAGVPDERLPSWNDREWYLRLSLCCEFKPISEPLVIAHRRENGGHLSQDFETKRDVSYPLFISKHRSLAATYGLERRFVASLSTSLAKAALRNGYYGDARKYLLKAAAFHPLNKSTYVWLLVVLGGRYTHLAARRVHRTLRALGER